MTKVVADISTSIDGFVTGPGADPAHGLGIGGEPIHAWVFDPDSAVDRDILASAMAETGAVIMGRNTFDVIDGPDGWSDEVGYGGETDAAPPPIFVVTHEAPEKVRLTARFTFVTDGVEQAVEQARKAAGDKDVFIMGGADVVTRCVAAGLVDEVRLHVAPLLLGAGDRLFDRLTELTDGPIPLTIASVVPSPHATHVTYARA
jgi:dihydrofolate reductase